MTSRMRAGLLLLGPVLGMGLFAGAAHAQLMEPNGHMIPVPSPMGEIMVVTSRGFPADSVTLPGLFHYRNENIDYVKDARIAPGSFSPRCGFSGQMVLRGGNCTVDFGWYNATEPPTMPDKINVLIPSTAYTDPNGYACSGALTDFCPLATHMTTQTQNTFVEKVYGSDATIRNSPNYKGGLVGFAFIGGGTSSRCSETHYSQQALNSSTDLSNGQHWITTLIWQSTAAPDSYYLGFEDLPMTAQNWSDGNNDGDFNDFVFYLSGLTCKGGGEPCTVQNAIGACAIGKTDCDSGTGSGTTCRSVYSPQPEICDNLDNDCNGQVDDGDGLCPPGRFCFQGTCVGNCLSGEFKCPPGLACSDGHCIDPQCASMTCEPGQICQGGQCVGACDGVKCPLGQECQLGRCIDPCANVDCNAGIDAGAGPMRVCEKGVCISNCSCRGCDNGQVCAPSGHCVDAGCENMTCGTGQVCVGGQCTDACTPDTVCPRGTVCINGVCPPPMPGDTGTTTGATTAGSTGGPIQVTSGDTAGSVGGSGVGTAGTDTAGATGTDTGLATGRGRGDQQSGCNCRLSGPSDRSPAAGAAAGALMGLAYLRLRRRRRTRASA